MNKKIVLSLLLCISQTIHSISLQERRQAVSQFFKKNWKLCSTTEAVTLVLAYVVAQFIKRTNRYYQDVEDREKNLDNLAKSILNSSHHTTGLKLSENTHTYKSIHIDDQGKIIILIEHFTSANYYIRWWLASMGQHPILDLLLTCNPNLNVPEYDGHTPLTVLIDHYNNVPHLYEEFNSKKDIFDLMCNSERERCILAIKKLLAHGANPRTVAKMQVENGSKIVETTPYLMSAEIPEIKKIFDEHAA